MTPVPIEFLVGLYFVVADAPSLLSKPLTLNASLRFWLGLLLVVFAIFGVSPL
jgi:hypothetical protein